MIISIVVILARHPKDDDTVEVKPQDRNNTIFSEKRDYFLQINK